MEELRFLSTICCVSQQRGGGRVTVENMGPTKQGRRKERLMVMAIEVAVSSKIPKAGKAGSEGKRGGRRGEGMQCAVEEGSGMACSLSQEAGIYSLSNSHDKHGV